MAKRRLKTILPRWTKWPMPYSKRWWVAEHRFRKKARAERILAALGWDLKETESDSTTSDQSFETSMHWSAYNFDDLSDGDASTYGAEYPFGNEDPWFMPSTTEEDDVISSSGEEWLDETIMSIDETIMPGDRTITSGNRAIMSIDEGSAEKLKEFTIKTTIGSIGRASGHCQESPMVFVSQVNSALPPPVNEDSEILKSSSDVRLIGLDDNNTMIVTAIPSEEPVTIVISEGTINLKLIYGKATANNYPLKRNEPLPVSIGLTEQAIFITQQLDSSSKTGIINAVKALAFPPEKLDEINRAITDLQGRVALLLATRTKSTQLSWIKWKSGAQRRELWLRIAGYERKPPVEDDWLSNIKELAKQLRTNQVITVVGPKSSGKSSYLRWLINASIDSLPNGLIYVDGDPGQTELSTPGQLQASIVKKPIISTTFVNIANTESSQVVASSSVGGVSLKQNPAAYVNAIKAIWSKVKSELAKEKRPVVVNTMGWTTGIGCELLVTLLRTVEPDHVVEIKVPKLEEGPNRSAFVDGDDFDYTQLFVNTAIDYLGQKRSTLGFKYTKLDRIKHVSFNQEIARNSRKARELAILANFSKIPQVLFSSLPAVEKRSISLTQLYLHCEWSYELLLSITVKSLHHSLVQLCHIEADPIVDGPKALPSDEAFTDNQYLLADAYTTVNQETQTLELVSAISDEQLAKVNLIIRPTGIELPKRLADDFLEYQFYNPIEE